METLSAPRGRHRPSSLESPGKAVSPARTCTLKTRMCSNAGLDPGQCEQNPDFTSAHVHFIHEKHQVTAPCTEPRRKAQPPPPTLSPSLGAPQTHRGYDFPPHGRKSSFCCFAKTRRLQPSSAHAFSQLQASSRQSAVSTAASVP